MRIATWNVNSVRARLEHVRRFLELRQPDCLCLQETKVVDREFPEDTFRADGYFTVRAGEPSYNGVAILARERPSDVAIGLDGAGADDSKRLIGATVAGLRVLSAYVPNGKALDSPGFTEKLEWLSSLRRTLDKEKARGLPVVLGGDFNIAREARDVWDPERMRGALHFSPREHEALDQVLGDDLVDALRVTTEEAGLYSWWDYRMSAFQRNRGLRIDYWFVSRSLVPRILTTTIDRTPRTWEKPSDHTPVVVEFAD